MSNWVDHRAIIDPGAELGNYIKIWAFAHVLPFATIGDHCSIGGCAEIGRDVVIGSHVRIGYGVFIPNKTKIGDYVFIGPRVVMTDDKYPMVENENYKAEPPIIEDNASIGAGAVLLPGVKIGRHALIGAGAVVTHDVPAGGIVIGNPGRVIRLQTEKEIVP